ncbi:hypothetical protein M758_2G097000 [Ceratodon purpureus]|nr:hypothetical protein M758_2G097000 [Ceratodon purpureus]
MGKQASEQGTTLDGPNLGMIMRRRFQLANAAVYVVATNLVLVGVVHMLPGWGTAAGLWCLLITLVLIVRLNARGLYFQYVGLSFRLKLDPQLDSLNLVKIAGLLLQIFGSLLFLFGITLLWRVTRGGFQSSDVAQVTNCAYSLLIAGSAFWISRSVQDSFLVYEDFDTRVQLMQKTVAVPLLLANTLILVSTILRYETWSLPLITLNAPMTATRLAIAATGLLFLSAIVNVICIQKMREFYQNGSLLEPLVGGAHEEVECKRDEGEVLRDKYAAHMEGGSCNGAVIQIEETTGDLNSRHPLLSSLVSAHDLHHCLIANYPKGGHTYCT